MRYSEEILDEIRNRSDIIEIISEYVHLKPSGKGYKGLCPFHQEKTPSFMVDREKQMFHCFGCGEGGNVFSFIMKIEKLNFPEAVKFLAEKASVQLPTDDNFVNQAYREKELILHFNEIAADYYLKNLFQNQGKNALQYLFQRRFSEQVIQNYHLGYALPGYEHLVQFMLQKKFQLSDLIKAGLAIRSRKNGKVMDYFRDRIIFPITNLQGNIIAFGGRVLDKRLPKYINSPETLVYNKGKHLYGLFQAKKGIQKNNQVIIVEGYTDVLIAHQYGFDNVVASLGTALTEQQVDLMKKYADEIIISFDSDSAGQNATLRSLSIIKEAGVKMRVLSLPAETDPADVILERGKEFFASLVREALPLMDYKLKKLMQRYNPKTSNGKIEIVRGLFQDLNSFQSQLELQVEVKKISEKLGLEEDSILQDLKYYKQGNRKLPNIQAKIITESTHVNAEKMIIGNMLQKRNDVAKIFSELTVEDFSVKEHREIVSVIKNLFKRGEEINVQRVIDELNDQKIINLLSKIMLEDIIMLNEETMVRSIKAIKKYRLKQELKKIESKIREQEGRKDPIMLELLQDYQDILLKIKTIV